ncbi:MAG: hypothetical protein ABIA37_03580 [Candidatus Woesearchaeota archaeon]
MFDESKARAKLDSLTKEFPVLIKQFSQEEQQRARFLEYVFRTGENKQQLIEITVLTVENMDKFIDIYGETLAYVLLLEPQGHHSETFKDLNLRYQILEKMIKKLRRNRIKQVKTLNRQSEIISRLSLWFLRTKVKKEIELTKTIVAATLKNKEEVARLNQLLKKEKKKQMAYAVVGGASFFVPVAGTALLILSTAVFDWINCLTPNYKKITSLIS